MTPREAFADQARSCRALGSPLTARVCERLGTALQRDQGPVARRVLGWPGDTSSRAASVPLRLAGGLHALILGGNAPELAAGYKTGDPPVALLLQTIAAHEDFVLRWLDSAPQTNEVARSAAIIAAAQFATRLRDLPIEALELGASAGLNLNFHRYSLKPNDHDSGQPVTGVVLRPDWKGDVPNHPINVTAGHGVDLRPIDPVRDGDRLLAYCWADQTERLTRLKAALALAVDHPCHVAAGDAAEWLEGQLAAPAPGRMTFVYHTIAWQYFSAEVQARCAAAMERAGAMASPEQVITHFAMEGDGAPDGAALRLQLWDGEFREWHLGRADFHGRWIDWSPRRV